MKIKPRHTLLFLLLALQLSCAVKKSRVNRPHIESESIPTSVNFADIPKESSLVYHFLTANLAYKEGDFQRAKEEWSLIIQEDNEDLFYIHLPAVNFFLITEDFASAEKELEKVIASLTKEIDNILIQIQEKTSLLPFSTVLPKQISHPSVQKLKTALYFYGRLLEERGDYQSARNIYSIVYSFNKKNPWFKIYEIASLWREGKKEQAIKEANSAIKESPKNPLLRYIAGVLYYYSADYKNAAKNLKIAYKTFPINENFILYIQSLILAGSTKTLKQTILEASKKYPDELVLKQFLKVLKDPREFKLLRKELKRSSYLERKNFRIHVELAKFMRSLHLFQFSLDELNLLLYSQPNNSTLRYLIASQLVAMGRKQEAVYKLLKISSDDLLYEKARLFAAVLLRKQNNDKEALKILQEAYKKGKNSSSIVLFLVDLYSKEKNYSEAISLLKNLIKQQKRPSVTLLYKLALLYFQKGDKRKSLDLMEKVIKLEPSHSDALNFLAYSLAEEDKNLERALNLVKKALEVQPADGYYLDTLGWVYFKQGNLKEAEHYIREAVKVTQNDLVILEHLAEILERKGNTKEAYQIYKRVWNLGKQIKEPTDEEREILNKVKEKLKRKQAKNF